MDIRVKETEPISKNAIVEKAGRMRILWSYRTPVAVHDTRDGVLFATSTRWSDNTVRHLNKFRRTCGEVEERMVDQLELEERCYTYLAKRARRERDKIANGSLDAESLRRVDEEKIREAVSRQPGILEVPIGTPIVFVPRKEGK